MGKWKQIDLATGEDLAEGRLRRRRTVTVFETVTGWAAEGRKYPSALSALRAIRRRDRALSTIVNATFVSTVRWETITPLGRQIATDISLREGTDGL